MRLSKSIRNYQDDRKKPQGERQGVGWPKFRSSKKKFFSLLFDEYGNGFRFKPGTTPNSWLLELSLGKTAEGKIIRMKVPLGEMPSWFSQSISEALKTYPKLKEKKSVEEKKKFHLKNLLPFTEMRIKREGKQWFAIFSAKKEIQKQTPQIQKVAVIDPNHKNLGYLVDSEGNAIEIGNLSFLKLLDQRMDEIKQRRDHCQRNSVRVDREDGSFFYKPSRRWTYFQNYLEELSRIRREQTKSALYAISNRVIQDYDLVGVGNYTPHGGGISRGMRRSMNNQSQIGKFKKTLQWVCQREGKVYYEWDERKSTKTCHRSGCRQETEQTKDPSVRVWICASCKTEHIRDENAAQNGSVVTLKWMKQQKQTLPCSGHLDERVESEEPFTVTSRWAWSFNGRGISVLRA